jgi:hypothetical protein
VLPFSTVSHPRLRLVPALLIAVIGSACSDDPAGPEPLDSGASFTVDASAAASWALVDLGSPAQLVPIADPASSATWDLGFQATKVMLNGGTSGPAQMVAHCLCQNAAATNEQVMAMTPESERVDFESVTRALIPAAPSSWSATVFDERRWYRYNLTGDDHQVWPTYEVYLVKRGNEVYKVQLTGYYGADGAPRQISFRYALLTD